MVDTRKLNKILEQLSRERKIVDVQKLDIELEQLSKKVKMLIYNNAWQSVTSDGQSEMLHDMVSRSVELHKIVQPKHTYAKDIPSNEPVDPNLLNNSSNETVDFQKGMGTYIRWLWKEHWIH